MKRCLSVAALFLLPLFAHAQTIPLTHGTTLSGQQLTLPADLHARATVLVLGFSQKSASLSTAWGKRIAALMGEEHDVASLQVPVLESVPRLIRGLVLQSIKNDVPATLQSTFLPVFEKEAEWKQAAGFSAPDDAYILVADAQGKIVWRGHGAVTDAQVEDLKAHLGQ